MNIRHDPKPLQYSFLHVSPHTTKTHRNLICVHSWLNVFSGLRHTLNWKLMDELDLREKGGPRQGQPQLSDRRLFMQLLAFGGVLDAHSLTAALDESGIEGVLYADVNDPRGVALVTWSDDPGFFVSTVRPLLSRKPFAELTPKLEYSMLGRTYALGHEPDLDDWLFNKPRRNATDPHSR